MNFFLPPICIFVILFKSVSVDAQFEPLLLVVENDPPKSWDLPSKSIPSLDDENIIAACPAERNQGNENLTTTSSNSQTEEDEIDGYCLFEKKFPKGQTNSKICAKEVKPMLQVHYAYYRRKKCPVRCGTADEKLFDYGFEFCETQANQEITSNRDNLDVISNLRYFLPIYELCIDESSFDVLWTRHEIKTPEMFHDDDKTKLRMETGEDGEIRTDQLQNEGIDNYIRLKQLYGSQQGHKLIANPNFLVPKEDIVLRVWRKTVNHFINVAPVWDKLQKLMTAINQGIKKIALELHSNNQKLIIYTKAKRAGGTIPESKLPKIFWFKLLHEITTNSAALIVLHSVPGRSLERKLCNTKLDCDLKIWYEKTDEDDEGISDEDDALDYAYCCYPNSREIKEIFQHLLLVEKPLNVDEYFKKNSQTDLVN